MATFLLFGLVIGSLNVILFALNAVQLALDVRNNERTGALQKLFHRILTAASLVQLTGAFVAAHSLHGWAMVVSAACLNQLQVIGAFSLQLTIQMLVKNASESAHLSVSSRWTHAPQLAFAVGQLSLAASVALCVYFDRAVYWAVNSVFLELVWLTSPVLLLVFLRRLTRVVEERTAGLQNTGSSKLTDGLARFRRFTIVLSVLCTVTLAVAVMLLVRETLVPDKFIATGDEATGFGSFERNALVYAMSTTIVSVMTALVWVPLAQRSSADALQHRARKSMTMNAQAVRLVVAPAGGGAAGAAAAVVASGRRGAGTHSAKPSISLAQGHSRRNSGAMDNNSSPARSGRSIGHHAQAPSLGGLAPPLGDSGVAASAGTGLSHTSSAADSAGSPGPSPALAPADGAAYVTVAGAGSQSQQQGAESDVERALRLQLQQSVV